MGGGGSAVRVEGCDVVLFSPEGLIQQIWQLRGPTPQEKRVVLEPAGGLLAA